ncbi:methyltransferase domain-containing protein [Magnetococcus sp. PR-3]|uniref:methyltransferase domain-containing protein n=1 Tax=Magnetococcus sp. PR-3 TaxID=3120355 RepID=UPI002FCE33B3
MDHFTTSGGRKIPFISGYREGHRRNWRFKTSCSATRGKKRVNFPLTFQDMFTYGMMADLLTRLGLWQGRKYKRSLDLGGAEGVVSSLLRAEGKVRTSSCIDIVDYRGVFPAWLHVLYHLKYRFDVAISKWLPVPAKWHVFRKNINKYGYHTNFHSSVWNLRLRRMPGIDEFVVGDLYDQKEQYDLITAFNAICYFDYDRLFGKVSELLEEDGVFFFLADYWWFPANSTTIYGDFPYACQRLDREELERYFREHYPEHADDMLNKYDYFHEDARRPTVADYVAAAQKHGLSLAGAERLYPSEASNDGRTPVVPAELQRYADVDLNEVLEDIHRTRPDVTLEDLHTVHVMMAFVKRSDKSEKLESRFDKS